MEDVPFDLVHGNSLEILKLLPVCSVHAIVTDPPYELGFMGKKWDSTGIAYNVALWKECLRVLKPGGHLLAFGGSRTYHRMTVAIEDAGFEIRDCIMWLYGSGFPKSMDVSKAIDKQAGAERQVVGEKTTPDGKPYSARTPNSSGEYNEQCAHNSMNGKTRHNNFETAPATEAAKQWEGWGTALKPAHEPIVVARKPLDGTVADNVQKWGCGGINIDGCRVGTAADMNPRDFDDSRRSSPKFSGKFNNGKVGEYRARTGAVPDGRFPANIVLDPEAGAMLDAQSGTSKSPSKPVKQGGFHGSGFHGSGYDVGKHEGDKKRESYGIGFGDSGGASRFFYCAKASKSERNAGDSKNDHATVKPLQLMRYLVRLVTPAGGLVVDPFMGSGTTGVACIYEGFRFIGIDITASHVPIADARLRHAMLDNPATEQLAAQATT